MFLWVHGTLAWRRREASTTLSRSVRQRTGAIAARPVIATNARKSVREKSAREKSRLGRAQWRNGTAAAMGRVGLLRASSSMPRAQMNHGSPIQWLMGEQVARFAIERTPGHANAKMGQTSNRRIRKIATPRHHDTTTSRDANETCTSQSPCRSQRPRQNPTPVPRTHPRLRSGPGGALRFSRSPHSDLHRRLGSRLFPRIQSWENQLVRAAL
jgi:hypothetical protein